MIHAKRYVLGRPVAKILPEIKISPNDIDVGYGPGKLKPDGSRQPETERRVWGKLIPLINGMSTQQTG